MNAARPHTDGEQHQGDTTRVERAVADPLRSAFEADDIILPGVVVRSDDMQTAADLAAGIWLIQNTGLPEEEQSDLPDGVTGEDVERAIRRQQVRRNENRRAIAAYHKTLSAPIPRTAYLCAGGCNRSMPRPGLCAVCTGPAKTIEELNRGRSRLTFRQSLMLVICILAGIACLALYAGEYVKGVKLW